MSARRIAARRIRRSRQRKRAWTKRMSCDPRRLWPVGTEQREWWDAMMSGDLNRILRVTYSDKIVQQVVWGVSPTWGLVKKWGSLQRNAALRLSDEL